MCGDFHRTPPRCRDLQILLASVPPGCAAVEGLPAAFQRIHDPIVLLQPHPLRGWRWQADLRSTSFARLAWGFEPPHPPRSNPRVEEAFRPLLDDLHAKNFLRSATLIGTGGIATALGQMCVASGLGCRVDMGSADAEEPLDAFFGEHPARALLTCMPSAHLALTNAIGRSGSFAGAAIGRVTASGLVLAWESKEVFRCKSTEPARAKRRRPHYDQPL